ncbi:MAG: hypothetical protein DDT26_00827 [Dehalococcoidia bacterium]|nr:hypothetical protein [Chloroflexota bacterium]
MLNDSQLYALTTPELRALITRPNRQDPDTFDRIAAIIAGRYNAKLGTVRNRSID